METETRQPDSPGGMEESNGAAPSPADGAAIPPSEARVADLTDKLLRLSADFDNFRRRNATVRSEARRDAKRDLLAAFLPVYDHFVMALDAAEERPEVAPFIEGFEMIRVQFDAFFREQGFDMLAPAEGDPFDPNVHEAAGILPATSAEMSGAVARTLQPGFTFDECLVRPARVLVFG